MAAIAAHTQASVPGVVSAEPPGEVLGAPFLLLQHDYGRVPSDDPPIATGGWVVELPETSVPLCSTKRCAQLPAQQRAPARPLIE
jgi:hypothetical protein